MAYSRKLANSALQIRCIDSAADGHKQIGWSGGRDMGGNESLFMLGRPPLEWYRASRWPVKFRRV